MGHQIAQFSLIVVLAAGMLSCRPERERQAGPPAGTTTLDVRALDTDGDGRILFRGRVVENMRGCEVDAACILRIEVDGAQTSVVYHWGEWPPSIVENDPEADIVVTNDYVPTRSPDPPLGRTMAEL